MPSKRSPEELQNSQVKKVKYDIQSSVTSSPTPVADFPRGGGIKIPNYSRNDALPVSTPTGGFELLYISVQKHSKLATVKKIRTSSSWAQTESSKSPRIEHLNYKVVNSVQSSRAK
jgi:hypothetical protein